MLTGAPNLVLKDVQATLEVRVCFQVRDQSGLEGPIVRWFITIVRWFIISLVEGEQDKQARKSLTKDTIVCF